jgi:hypothetical protein
MSNQQNRCGDPVKLNIFSLNKTADTPGRPDRPRSRGAAGPPPAVGALAVSVFPLLADPARRRGGSIPLNPNVLGRHRRVCGLRENCQFVPQGVPDIYGFNGIDAARTIGDTIALTYPAASA